MAPPKTPSTVMSIPTEAKPIKIAIVTNTYLDHPDDHNADVGLHGRKAVDPFFKELTDPLRNEKC